MEQYSVHNSTNNQHSIQHLINAIENNEDPQVLQTVPTGFGRGVNVTSMTNLIPITYTTTSLTTTSSLVPTSHILASSPITIRTEPEREPGHFVYFCFEDSKFDSIDHPNKVFIAKTSIVCKDLSLLLRNLFNVSCPMGFKWKSNELEVEEAEMSETLIPVDDRLNVIIVKKVQAILDTSLFGFSYDIWTMLAHYPISASLIHLLEMKFEIDIFLELTDFHLKCMGIPTWQERAIIMYVALQYKQLRKPQPNNKRPAKDDDNIEEEEEDVILQTTKKSRNKRPKLRFKDIDVIAAHPKIPIGIGSIVYCKNSNIEGIVVDRNGKAIIEYELDDGKKRYASIAKFYKDVTNQTLQEKGESWSQIFFVDVMSSQAGPPYDPKHVKSLEEIKYIIKGPKKSISAFLYFCNEQRQNSTDFLPSDFARQVGDMWKALPEDQKQRFRILEAQDKERFQREKQEWEALNGSLSEEEAITTGHIHSIEDDSMESDDNATTTTTTTTTTIDLTTANGSSPLDPSHLE